MRRIVLGLIALAMAGSAPAANQDPAALQADLDTLALVARDARLAVPVRIADAGPWPFIIDTGAQRTVISRELASVLKLARGRDVQLIAMTGASRVPTAIIPSLGVGPITGAGIEAPALAAQHLGAPGLLGIDTLQDRKVTIDFAAQTMAVSPSQRRRRPLQPMPGEIVVTARNLFGQLVVTDAEFRGRQVRVVLDTGTAVSVGNDAFHRLAGTPAGQAVSMTSVVGDQLHARQTIVDDVILGAVRFDNLPVAFADAAPFRQFRLHKRPALLLGMNALALFPRVDIDFANRELRLLTPPGMKVGRARTATAY